MGETEINDADAYEPESCPAPEPETAGEGEGVSDSWQQVVQGVLGLVIFVSTLILVHYYKPSAVEGAAVPNDLEQQVHNLTAQVDRLKQEQAMPTVVLNRYRNSIGYIYGVYQVGFPNKRPEIRARVSGTGFLIGEGLIATNRHVAEPWYGDSEAQNMIDRGAIASLENLVVFFPASPTPVNLLPGAVSKTSDLAVVRAEDFNAVRGLPRLPLAKSPGAPGQ